MMGKEKDSPDRLVSLMRSKLADLDRDLASFQATVEGDVKADIKAGHRRAHRRGIPAKIDADPDLRAFIIARLDTHPFTAICAEAAAHFPQNRRTSMSALSRWWQREGQFLPPQPQNIT